jgi:hypothetical protein
MRVRAGAGLAEIACVPAEIQDERILHDGCRVVVVAVVVIVVLVAVVAVVTVIAAVLVEVVCVVFVSAAHPSLLHNATKSRSSSLEKWVWFA